MSDYDELVARTLAERPEVEAIRARKAQRARVASALRALRGRTGLSQRQLAANTGWAQSYIARLESIADNQMPTPETIIRYAEACGAKVGLILLDPVGVGYRVGDAVALTDDPAAENYLAGLAKGGTSEIATETAEQIAERAYTYLTAAKQLISQRRAQRVSKAHHLGIEDLYRPVPDNAHGKVVTEVLRKIRQRRRQAAANRPRSDVEKGSWPK